MPTFPFPRRAGLGVALGLLTLLAEPAPVQAQQPAPNYRLELRSGAITPPANLDEFMASPMPADISGGVYVRVVQFWSLMTRDRRARLEKAWHVKLLQYLPNNAYLVAFPASFNRVLLNGYGVRSVVKLDAAAKLHPLLATSNVPGHARRGNAAALIVQYLETADPAAVRAALEAQGTTVEQTDEANHQLLVLTPLDKIRTLADIPTVLYAEPAPAPPQREDRPGRSNHRVNYINSDSPLGLHYDGSGVHVALGDDGMLGPHIDYQGRTDQVQVQGTNSGDHGDHVAGIIMGGGNFDPRQRGMATGAELKAYAPFTNINSAPADYGPFGIRITSTSYGDGCHAGYTAFAQTCDRQTRQLPALLHVFSAGNSGGTSCGFLNSWGTITGGNKTGKNVIAVAAVDFHDQLASFSSWGPVTDGRIKPDLAAVGVNVNSTLPNNTYGPNSGTSMACPGISGTSAVLYSLWRANHNASDPDAGLIKGVMMATADDLGRPGPDFKFGYGRVNARRAAQTLLDNRLMIDSVDQGDQRQLSITVPPGTQQLRVLTYWSDYEGTVQAARALVNNLDMRVVAPDSTNYQPWVLNPAPNATTLDMPATRGRDSLNNVEQVTLDAPAPGTYRVRITGAAVPQGPQKFFTFYELLTDSIVVTYPIGGETFAPADGETLRWDAYGDQGTFELSLSADGGATWQQIGNVPGTQRYYDWQPTTARNGQRLLFRVKRGTHVGQSPALFSIQTPPSGLSFVRVCPDSATLTWTAVPGAARYDIFRLGARYMDSIGTATTNRFTITPTDPTVEDWVSVRAVTANGATSRRANAIRRAPGVANCVFAFDAELTQLLSPAAGTTSTCSPNAATTVAVRVRNAGAQAVGGMRVYYRVDNGSIVSDSIAGPIAANQTVNHTFSTPALLTAPGTYRVVAWARIPGDANRYNDSARAVVALQAGTTGALPHMQNLDTWAVCATASDCGTTVCPLPNGWRNETNGSADDIDWRVNSGATPSTGTGPDIDHTLGTTAGRYLYLEASNNCFSKTAVLTSPCFQLPDSIAQEFTFWYHAYGANMGELHVDVLPDSGAAVLDAIPAVIGDQGNQWLLARVSLAPFRGRTVTLRVRGITGSDFASDLALDDFGVQPMVVQGVRTEAQALADRLNLLPNPTTGAVRLSRPDLTDGALAITVLDVQGRRVWHGTVAGLETTLELGHVPAGTYAVRVVSAHTSIVRRLVVQR